MDDQVQLGSGSSEWSCCLTICAIPFVVILLIFGMSVCSSWGKFPVVIEECSDEWDDVVEQARTNGFRAFDKYGEGNGQLVGFGLTGEITKQGELDGRSMLFFDYTAMNVMSRRTVNGSFGQWVDHNTCEVTWN